MADDKLIASESALLVVLMAEAREVLQTELQERYGLVVRKPSRDKLVRLRYLSSRKSGRSIALTLEDDGWVRVQKDLDFKARGAAALGAALTALQAALRDRVLARSGCASLAELFALTDVRALSAAPSASDQDLRVRVKTAYDALAEAPGAWVGLARLRPFLADVPREAVDETLRLLSRESGVNIVPESNQKMLTETDAQAALHIGGQDKHLLAIGV
ncbi:hypothetical protein FB565_001600 [Actinoplanes lutulentus]|uniref:Uncharacterized protein n=1 Tax=Actinoplanes lutulentus TaxID=1287878 RepID=A0A327ZG67_9ACTN|nr:hypothetical protein [Actinoplanes lutulentus]MBB2941896.1 hypothetical protein [Actinoplanes lutulentus]RAK39813.1 hypothetical protein B0I29_104352 [Actinoplanes lutulentus]